jgi:hypothetical protein
MNARLRTCLLVALVGVGWAAVSPAVANAQRVTVYSPMVGQYLPGAYGGYAVQPQYYGGYSYAPQYYSTYSSGYGATYAPSYSSGYGYPVYSGYSTPGYSYPAYSYPSYAYPSYGYRTGYRGSYYRY